jgi:5'-nucleotidase
MKILISNDDGIAAEGIQTIIRKLSVEHELLVVAPDRNRSGTSSSVTFDIPVRVERAEGYADNVKAFICNGTPADCTKIGLEEFAEKELGSLPDLVVSGINHGVNLGSDIFYSGTVAAAMEGTFRNIPSIACSLDRRPVANFDLAGDILVAWINEFASYLIRPDSRYAKLFNINIPSFADPSLVKGFRTTTQGIKRYVNIVDRRIDPSGNSYFWLHGTAENTLEENTPDSDVVAHHEGYISVTPLELNLTYFSSTKN